MFHEIMGSVRSVRHSASDSHHTESPQVAVDPDLLLTPGNMSSVCCAATPTPLTSLDLYKVLVVVAESFRSLDFIMYSVPAPSTFWAACESSCLTWNTHRIFVFPVEPTHLVCARMRLGGRF